MSASLSTSATATRAPPLEDTLVAWPLTSAPAVPSGGAVVCEGGAAVVFRAGEVFYNPVQLFNRDLSVMAIRAWDELRGKRASARERARAWGSRGLPAPSDGSMPPLRIFEALSATGLRSLRYAAELPPERVALIVANDLEPTAARAIASNAAFNGSCASVVVPNAGDAILVAHLAARGLALLPGMEKWCIVPPMRGSTMTSEAGGGSIDNDDRVIRKSADENGGGDSHTSTPVSTPTPPFLFDNVDLDPYGSAAPFLDSAIGAIADGGLLAVTCTDMAVLAGTHMDACRAKYGSIPVRARHFGEQALRILLATIETAANKRRRSVRVLASVCVDFYIRVFVSVHDSPADAATSGARMANIHQCTGCDAFWLWPLGRYGKGAVRPSGIFWPGDDDKNIASVGISAGAGADGAGVGVGAVIENSTSSVIDETTSGDAMAVHAVKRSRSGDDRPTVSITTSSIDTTASTTTTTFKPAAVPIQQHQRPSHVGANIAPDLPCSCPHCGRPIAVGGPIWSGPIHDSDFLKTLESLTLASFGIDGSGGNDVGSASGVGSTATATTTTTAATASSDTVWLPRPKLGAPSFYSLRARGLPRLEGDGGSNGISTTAASRRRLLGVLHSLNEELLDVPLYYEVGALASRVKASTRPLTDIFAAIENAGYRASGSHASPNVLKTNAPPSVVMEIVRAMKKSSITSSSSIISGGAKSEAAAVAALELKLSSAKGQSDGVGIGGSGHTSYFETGHLLSSMPIDDAILSSISLRPTEIELPLIKRPVSFIHTPSIIARMALRKEEKGRGEGQRFVPNPGANWGPKARATGAKKVVE